MPMQNISVVFLRVTIVCLIFFPIDTIAEQQTGPLGVFNQLPPHMIFLTPRPHSPRSLSKKSISGALAFDYFSVYSNTFSSDHRILMDMEAAVLDFRFGYGLTDRLSFWVRMPVVSMGDGFMDDSLELYHRALGLPNYGKEKSPEDTFAYIIEKDGQPWFTSKKGGLNITDMTLSAQFELLDFNIAVPVKAGLTYEAKLPTGDEARGFGSGAWDHGIFVPFQFSFSRINLYLMPGYIRIGTPENGAVELSVQDIKSFFIGGEFFFSPTVSFLVQINSYTSPFVNTGITKLDALSAELAAGVRWSFARPVSLEFAFCEDLTMAAPDFNLHFMLTFEISHR